MNGPKESYVGGAHAGSVARRQRRELLLEALVHTVDQRLARCHEDRHGRRVVLGLRQQIGSDRVGAGRVVGDNEALGRACEHVDRAFAKH
jgi:hypothetical protein